MDAFLENVKKKAINFDIISRAYALGKKAHAGQKRLKGEDYFSHPINVASTLLGYTEDTATIAAALLHDTVEDTDVTLEDIQKEFDNDIVHLVDALTKIEKTEDDATNQTLTHQKILEFGETDHRVFLIKLADIIDNLSTVEVLGKEKAKKFCKASLVFYLPIAQKLKLLDFAREIERLAKKHI